MSTLFWRLMTISMRSSLVFPLYWARTSWGRELLGNIGGARKYKTRFWLETYLEENSQISLGFELEFVVLLPTNSVWSLKPEISFISWILNLFSRWSNCSPCWGLPNPYFLRSSKLPKHAELTHFSKENRSISEWKHAHGVGIMEVCLSKHAICHKFSGLWFLIQ